MNVLVGLGGLCALLYYAAFAGHTGAFTGFLHIPALVLLAAGPPCVALISFRWEQLFACARTLARAIRFSAARSRAQLFDDVTRFATELRQRRPAAALEVADTASHELFRQLAPLVVKQYAAEELEATASTATFCLASSHKRSEGVLAALARIAPAMGLVGTVLGLVTLLRDLSSFDKLGPSMALALLCTLYGLVLANALYQPLAKQVHQYATISMEEARLLTRALVLVREGRPAADVRALFQLASDARAEEPEPVVPAAGGAQ